MQEGEGVAVDVGAVPAVGPARLEFAVNLPDQIFEARCRCSQGVESIEHVAGGERHRGVGVGGDGLDPFNRAVLAGRIRGHGDRATVEASHEGGDEIEAGGIEQQHPLADHAPVHQPCPHRSGLPVELGVGDVEFFVFAVDEEGEAAVVGPVGRPLPQEIDDRGGE